MTEKYCKHCGETKPASEWNKQKRSADGLFSECKACRKIRNRKYRRATGQPAQAAHRANNKLRAIKYLGGSCEHCGFDDLNRPEVFDFHHVDPSAKSFGISRKLHYPWETLEPELKKCILLCANCHRTEEAK